MAKNPRGRHHGQALDDWLVAEQEVQEVLAEYFP